MSLSKETIAALDALPPAKCGNPGHQWTKDEDAALLKHWPVKEKMAVAKALGISVNVCRARYRELTR